VINCLICLMSCTLTSRHRYNPDLLARSTCLAGFGEALGFRPEAPRFEEVWRNAGPREGCRKQDREEGKVSKDRVV
jgi:hypothetical protein